jgi:transposase
MARVEIITGKERRHRWTQAEKAQLVAEVLAPGAIVAQVARRHGVAESCLYAWRKQVQQGLAACGAESVGLSLLPISVEPAAEPGRPAATQDPAPAPAPVARATITLPDGTRLEIDATFPAATIDALITALRARR